MEKSKNTKVKIVLTGGHGATQAMAISEELKYRYPDLELYWIGSKYAMPGSRVTTPEYKLFPEIGVYFYPLIVGKLQTKFTRYTVPLLLGIPLSFFQALWFMLRLRPKVILSFGGFSSLPVIFWGWIFRIPIILHEQTVAAGRASIVSAFFSSQVALSREESLRYFPKSKSVMTGNPIMKEVLSVKPKEKLGKTRNILVIGGSRGSEFINEEVFKILPQLLKKYKVTMVTGEANFHKYKRVSLEGFKVFAYADPTIVRPRLYEDSDLIIGRAGASTVSEILYIKRPAILIPLPRTFMDEQPKNASYAKKFGIAKILTETDVSSGLLVGAIDETFENWETIVKEVLSKTTPDEGATQRIADIVGKYI